MALYGTVSILCSTDLFRRPVGTSRRKALGHDELATTADHHLGAQRANFEMRW